MGLNIKNEAVERDIRDLAELSGRSLTDSVGYAVGKELAALRQERASKMARVREIQARVKAKGVKRWWKDGEDPAAYLYDENGLPK
jgi:hypothetical protein